jgi:hypothetical protein
MPRRYGFRGFIPAKSKHMSVTKRQKYYPQKNVNKVPKLNIVRGSRFTLSKKISLTKSGFFNPTGSRKDGCSKVLLILVISLGLGLISLVLKI